MADLHTGKPGHQNSLIIFINKIINDIHNWFNYQSRREGAQAVIFSSQKPPKPRFKDAKILKLHPGGEPQTPLYASAFQFCPEHQFRSLVEQSSFWAVAYLRVGLVGPRPHQVRRCPTFVGTSCLLYSEPPSALPYNWLSYIHNYNRQPSSGYSKSFLACTLIFGWLTMTAALSCRRKIWPEMGRSQGGFLHPSKHRSLRSDALLKNSASSCLCMSSINKNEYTTESLFIL